MLDIFQNWKTPLLRGHLVWIPMLSTDNLEAAIKQESLFQNIQISQYWDGDQTMGGMVSQTLKLSIPVAWDIYLLYSSGTIWEGERMPLPEYWMHQLDERIDLYLDPDRLMAEVQKAIEETAIWKDKLRYL